LKCFVPVSVIALIICCGWL